MKNFIYARGDDWEGIYVDGALVLQDHSVSLNDFAMLVAPLGPFHWKIQRVDLDWLEYEGSLPMRIEDVKWDDKNV
jgi:hypothetical protein